MKKVRDFMCHDVLFVRPNNSVFDVAKVFSKNNISGAPVVDNGKVVGVISISDIIKFMRIKLSDGKILGTELTQSLSMILLNLVKMGKDFVDFKKDLERISKTEIKHMMSNIVVAIEPNADLFEAANVMEKNDVNRLPVIDNGKLIGIIARADLIRALIE
jgi:CBS domain-containing protein